MLLFGAWCRRSGAIGEAENAVTDARENESPASDSLDFDRMTDVGDALATGNPKKNFMVNRCCARPLVPLPDVQGRRAFPPLNAIRSDAHGLENPCVIDVSEDAPETRRKVTLKRETNFFLSIGCVTTRTTVCVARGAYTLH